MPQISICRSPQTEPPEPLETRALVVRRIFDEGQVYNWLVNAGIPQPCAGAPSGVWTCTLEKPGGYKALVVWDVHGGGSYAPPAGYRRYSDLAGNAIVIEAGTKVTIGAKPILLEKR